MRGKPVTTDGKTDAARRLTLDPHLAQVLTRHRDHQGRAGVDITDASSALAVYAHVMPNDDRIAAAIADVLFPAPNRPTGPTGTQQPQWSPERRRSPLRGDDRRQIAW